jgi:hypothetical protein
MVGIVKTAFQDNEDCERCKVRVSGHYLADQGVVFNVEPASGIYQFVYDDDIEVVTHEFVTGIPGMVSDILEEVSVNLDDTEHTWEWHYDNGETLKGPSRESREALRESRRAMREASRELREVAIEMIHAEEDERAELQKRETEIESRIAELESRQHEVEEEVSKLAENRARVVKARREERREKQDARIKKIENVVLDTFCDYSSTMRSLPRNEKISIIVKQTEDASNVYVFDQDKLASCDSSKGNVRKHALSYVF